MADEYDAGIRLLGLTVQESPINNSIEFDAKLVENPKSLHKLGVSSFVCCTDGPKVDPSELKMAPLPRALLSEQFVRELAAGPGFYALELLLVELGAGPENEFVTDDLSPASMYVMTAMSDFMVRDCCPSLVVSSR
jgi:hypothetical protein